MAQQKSEDRVVAQGGVMPAEPAGSSPGGQGKAVPVKTTVSQLELPIATAEDSEESARAVASNPSGTDQAGAPKAIVNAETATPVTMEEVVKRLTSAMKKVASNKGVPGADGMTVEALREQWPAVHRGLSDGLLAGAIARGRSAGRRSPRRAAGSVTSGSPTWQTGW